MSNVTDIGEAKKQKRKPKAPPTTPQAWPKDAAWWAQLRLNDAGVPKNTLGNAELFLEHEATYAGTLRWNEMAAVVEMSGEPVGDADVTSIRVTFERVYLVAFSETDVMRAAELVARRRSYHPVRAYLEGLKWDGTVRIPELLEHVLHAEVTPLHEVYLRKFLISAVARAMKPGSKVDTVLILQGGQGAGKSTFFRVLGAPWFTDTEMDLGNKDAYLTLGSSWLVEWGELNTLSRATQERAKAFLSASEDIFRQPYGRAMTRLPRTAVIVGSTNQTTILHDETGSRRFWILPVLGRVDVARLRVIRDLIWAEAMTMFLQGEPWWLTADEDAERAEIAERYEGEDVWTPTILDWAEGRDSFTTAKVLEAALSIPAAQQRRAEENRAATVLTRAGFLKERHRLPGGRRAYLWRRPSTLLETIPGGPIGGGGLGQVGPGLGRPGTPCFWLQSLSGLTGLTKTTGTGRSRTNARWTQRRTGLGRQIGWAR